MIKKPLVVILSYKNSGLVEIQTLIACFSQYWCKEK